MTTYGLLSTGFLPKPESAIRDDLDAGCRTTFNASVPLGDKTLLGGYNAIVAAAIAECWALAAAIYASRDPDGATGEAEDALCAITGTRREPARASTVVLTWTGTPLTAVATGTRGGKASVGAEQFATTADTVLVELDAWVAATPYVIGDRVTNGGNAYVCRTAGTSAGFGGPTTTDPDITDNTAHWRYMGAGTGAGDAPSACTVDGPVEAVSGDVSVIITPVGGVSGVVNLLDADVGADLETDAALRVRRADELAADDASVPDAIREAVLKSVAQGGAGATSCTVFYNDTDFTDSDGVPPHAVEVLARGGEDQDVVDVIFAHVAAGIATHGSSSGTATDSEGTAHSVEYTRPDEIAVYATLTVEYDADLYPADGDTQVKAAIVAWGDGFKTGRNVTASGVSARAFAVAGVLDVTVCHIGTAPSPGTSTTIAVALRELAVFDTSRIVVSSSAVTP